MILDFETISQYGGIDFFAKKAVEGFIIGLHKSPYQGFSVEFSEHKAYTPGESTKNIDWKLFAKTDRLYKKVYDEETNLRAYILLDTSPSMNHPFNEQKNKLNYAKYCAAALIKLFHSQRDSISLVTFDDQIKSFSKNKTSASHANLLLEELKQTSVSEGKFERSNISQTLFDIVKQIPKRSVIIILSDMIYHQESNEEFFKSVAQLHFEGHETLIFQLFDSKTEFELDFDTNNPVQLTDLETNEKVLLKPSDISKQNIENLKNRITAFESYCKKHKTELIKIDINKPINQVLVPYLLKR